MTYQFWSPLFPLLLPSCTYSLTLFFQYRLTNLPHTVCLADGVILFSKTEADGVTPSVMVMIQTWELQVITPMPRALGHSLGDSTLYFSLHFPYLLSFLR